MKSIFSLLLFVLYIGLSAEAEAPFDELGVLKDTLQYEPVSASDLHAEIEDQTYLQDSSLATASPIDDTLLSPKGNGDTRRLSLKKYFLNYLRIPYSAGQEVVRTDRVGLTRNIVVLSAFATALTLDLTVRDLVQDKLYVGDNAATSFLYKMGDKDYILPAFAAAYGFSLITRNRYMHDTMLYSLQSLVIAQAFTELSKKAVGRVRPRNSPDDPFEREYGNYSFVSGHASGTWAAMTVIGGRYPRLKIAAYALAAAVAASRIYEDAHWTSDVLMGSLLGYGIGHLTLRLNDAYGSDLSVTPLIIGRSQGVMVNLQF